MPGGAFSLDSEREVRLSAGAYRGKAAMDPRWIADTRSAGIVDRKNPPFFMVDW